jgi:hypothetical protein
MLGWCFPLPFQEEKISMPNSAINKGAENSSSTI